MKTRISLIAAFAALLFLVGCSKDPQPSTSEIKRSLATQLPAFAHLSNFSIEAMQNIGTKVDPAWHARFHAKLTRQRHLRLAPAGEIL
jgi:PBP1b-binding outer membrane lipoprotein LpoB